MKLLEHKLLYGSEEEMAVLVPKVVAVIEEAKKVSNPKKLKHFHLLDSGMQGFIIGYTMLLQELLEKLEKD